MDAEQGEGGQSRWQVPWLSGGDRVLHLGGDGDALASLGEDTGGFKFSIQKQRGKFWKIQGLMNLPMWNSHDSGRAPSLSRRSAPVDYIMFRKEFKFHEVQYIYIYTYFWQRSST